MATANSASTAPSTSDTTTVAGDAPDPGPTIFVLFGATGDLAKRMVLPAFYKLWLETLLPKEWLLVGNGRGDVAHEDFRAHFHDVLEEFGPKPEPAQWQEVSEQRYFAGGGFNTNDPGSLLDVPRRSSAATRS